MTTKLPPPRPKDPTKRTRLPTRPPGNRSREAHGLTAMAAAGRFALQTCADCGTVQYPPRQVCGNCLGDRLQWRDAARGGRLLAETTLAHSNDLFFRDRLPWRLGVVHADAGPSMVAHLAEDCAAGERVRLALAIDRAGNAVVTARPEEPTPNPEDDRQLREMAFDPTGRRVLIVDGKTALGAALVRAFAGAGARAVYVGHAQPWRRSPHLDAAREIDTATLFPLGRDRHRFGRGARRHDRRQGRDPGQQRLPSEDGRRGRAHGPQHRGTTRWRSTITGSCASPAISGR